MHILMSNMPCIGFTPMQTYGADDEKEYTSTDLTCLKLSNILLAYWWTAAALLQMVGLVIQCPED